MYIGNIVTYLFSDFKNGKLYLDLSKNDENFVTACMLDDKSDLLHVFPVLHRIPSERVSKYKRTNYRAIY